MGDVDFGNEMYDLGEAPPDNIMSPEDLLQATQGGGLGLDDPDPNYPDDEGIDVSVEIAESSSSDPPLEPPWPEVDPRENGNVSFEQQALLEDPDLDLRKYFCIK